MIDKVKAVGTESSARTIAQSVSPSTTRAVSFAELLAKFSAQSVATALQETPSLLKSTESVEALSYTVHSGDTLYNICADTLASNGKAVSNSDVTEAVRNIAQANNLKNINRIYAGQKLDLSAITKDASSGVATTKSETAVTRSTPQGGPVASGTAQKSLSFAERVVALIENAKSAKEAASSSTTAIPPIVDGKAYVSSGYGLRKDPFTGQQELHTGIDIGAKSGTKITPLEAGTVTFSGWQSGYGRVVIVQHENGEETLYAHNSRNLVKVGQAVDTNTTIAKVGSSGRSSGPHVHFEVRKNGAAVNPASYVEASLKVAKAL